MCAQCFSQIVRTLAVPAGIAALNSAAAAQSAVAGLNVDSTIAGLRDGVSTAAEAADKLTALVSQGEAIDDAMARAEFFLTKVKPVIAEKRAAVDQIETLVPADQWPLPTYAHMLFNQD